MRRLVLIASLLIAASIGQAQTLPAAPAPTSATSPADDAQRRLNALEMVVAQRNQALDGLALCAGDQKAVQALLTKVEGQLRDAQAADRTKDKGAAPAAK